MQKISNEHPLSILICSLILFSSSCVSQSSNPVFEDDLKILQQVDGMQVLSAGDAKIAVVGKFQGRVITSTSRGLKGNSYGWFHRKMISSNSYTNNYSSLGGESRIWFGPEIGKYSVFFEPGTEQTVKFVKRPIDLDTVNFKLLKSSKRSVTYGNKLSIINYQGFKFLIDIERHIHLFDNSEIEKNLGITLEDGVSSVGFEVKSTMKNAGQENWNKEQGLLSIWDIGCMTPSKKAIVIIPVRGNPKEVTNYFTPLDDSRIKIKNNTVFYKSDADYLNKIGIPPEHTKPIFGSYNPDLRTLTIVTFRFDNDPFYVNSNWEDQTDPYAGDVINVFNDGSIGSGKPFGPFYELETSSSAKELKVGQQQEHIHTTYHFEGDQKQLSAIAEKLLGVSLMGIEYIFN